ncbi:MAG: D-alanine--D-alanine ligase [Desulfobacterium sp.]|jgi:D-alanine-D-alanine ligase|nr:D-alanine--D-alanine ligase [Desulfobacterium sp.]
MGKIKLALLSGGISSEREVSLNGGAQVYEALDKERYDIVRYDPATDLADLVNDAGTIDVALLILHGPYGEDGTVQGLLDLLGIPYQGAGVLGSSVAMNKLVSKRLYRQAGIPTPEFLSFSREEKVDLAFCVEQLGLPIVVKPVSAGSSVGMSIVKQAGDLGPALEKAFEQDTAVLLEAYVKGLELTCAVMGNKDLEALPVIEILPGEGHEFFDYDAKYVAGRTEEICPARIDDSVRKTVQALAVEAHKALFLRGYSRTDMILSENGVTVLETNTIPGMTKTSLLPQAAKAGGYSFTLLLDRLIELAMENSK